MSPPPLHDDLAPLAFLAGVWEGEGEGDYRNVEPFRYRERASFTHDGRPFLFYEQRTWRTGPDGNEMPSHTELGFLRGDADGRVEAVIAQTGGNAEVAVGEARGNLLELASSRIVQTPSAKLVNGLWRVLALEGETLHVTVDMSAVGSPRAFHLDARLRQSSRSTISGA
jgi:hypothetical protein